MEHVNIMDYLDRPQEIEHISLGSILAIHYFPEISKVLVVYTSGHTSSFYDSNEEVKYHHFIKKTKRVKYLKSIEKILNENPGCWFTERGSLSSKEWYINSEMLQYFGKPFEDRDKSWFYCESWIEEREV